MTGKQIITQVCVVVNDVHQVNANWAKVLGVPEAEIETVFSGGIVHYTYGQPAEYTDCQVAKYQLDSFVLELIQPGPSASPWRTFLEKNGQGVFHFCIFVDDRKVFQQTLSSIGVDMPYHVGYFPTGSYSYVNAKEQLGLELSVGIQADYQDIFQGLLDGKIKPMDEMR